MTVRLISTLLAVMEQDGDRFHHIASNTSLYNSIRSNRSTPAASRTRRQPVRFTPADQSNEGIEK